MIQLGEDYLKRFKEFDSHSSVFKIDEPKYGFKAFIAIHREKKNIPAFGATRYRSYKTEEDAIANVLNLSKLMSYKSAFASFPFTGGKAVIVPEDGIKEDKKELIFSVYADYLNQLNRRFVTGSDIGVSKKDVEIMRRQSDFIVGLTVFPALYTAISVYQSIEVALKDVFGSADIKGKTIAIQGLGKTGFWIMEKLANAGANLIVSDFNQDILDKVKNDFKNVSVVDPDKIIEQEVDIFCPCAIGGVINNQIIDKLKSKIIVGSANLQLEDDSVDEILYQKGITYIPDYIANAGGLISVVDEYQNGLGEESRIIKKIYQNTDKLSEAIKKSKINKVSILKSSKEITFENYELNS